MAVGQPVSDRLPTIGGRCQGPFDMLRVPPLWGAGE